MRQQSDLIDTIWYSIGTSTDRSSLTIDTCWCLEPYEDLVELVAADYADRHVDATWPVTIRIYDSDRPDDPFIIEAVVHSEMVQRFFVTTMVAPRPRLEDIINGTKQRVKRSSTLQGETP